MSYMYAVLGAGRQGIAAAYDMAKFGDAAEVILVDLNEGAARAGAERINELLNRRVASAVQADVTVATRLAAVLEGIDSFLSAVPYSLNLAIMETAIAARTSMCDLGGNTAVVRKQLDYDSEARDAGISIIPDCGMGPGMNISLALYAMSFVDEPMEVYIWDGGLPQERKPPWNFGLSFDIRGLSNEYSGSAHFLREGKIVKVPCFDGYEQLDFPEPLGRLEAFVTSGGLSTTPWTFEGKLARLENRTLRYPGHWAQFSAFAELGLLETEPVQIGDVAVIPREFFHAMLEPKITGPDVRDVGVMRVKCIGVKEGRRVEAVVELVDYYDENTGFTAMQRLTGWHASIVAILAARGEISRGATPIELAVPGERIVEEARLRGFAITERVSRVG